MEQLNIEYNFTSESRAFCVQCDFLKSRCLCDTLRRIDNKTHIVVLQHPTEVKHPLNTVRIMKKSFSEMTILMGEDFSNDLRLNTLLCDPANNVALLYPSAQATVLSAHSAQERPITHLVLIDGTWRKAKKIFLSSVNLQSLPALKLDQVEKSNYKIRKAPSENALSTLEAGVQALKMIEPNLNTQAAMDSFDKMISMQIEKMGRTLYQQNYLGKK